MRNLPIASRSSSPKSVLVDVGGVFRAVYVGRLLSDVEAPCVVPDVGEVEPMSKFDNSGLQSKVFASSVMVGRTRTLFRM